MNKINALFFENKQNLGNPQFAGFVFDFYEDMPELVAYALPRFFSDKKACGIFAKKLRQCFDNKEDKEGFFDEMIKTELYGWHTSFKVKKNEITVYFVRNLSQFDTLKPGSGSMNESEDDTPWPDRSKAYEAFDNYLKDSSKLTDEEKKLVADAEKELDGGVYVGLWNDAGNLKSAKTTLEKAMAFFKSVHSNDAKLKLTKKTLDGVVKTINDKDALVILPREDIDDEQYLVIGLENSIV